MAGPCLDVSLGATSSLRWLHSHYLSKTSTVPTAPGVVPYPLQPPPLSGTGLTHVYPGLSWTLLILCSVITSSHYAKRCHLREINQ